VYLLAFVENDTAGSAQEIAWSRGSPGIEDVFLDVEADTSTYSGQLTKSRELSRAAVASALHAKQKETAANHEAAAALREAFLGNIADARQRATAALALSSGRDVQYPAALALALSGDSTRAQTLANELKQRYPDDTIVQFMDLPTLRAQLALNRNDSARAVEELQSAAPYELGNGMQAIYLRGEAYLSARDGSKTVAEFQKIIDHRTLVLNYVGALARAAWFGEWQDWWQQSYSSVPRFWLGVLCVLNLPTSQPSVPSPCCRLRMLARTPKWTTSARVFPRRSRILCPGFRISK
jgi:hypothetical protein